MFKKIIISLGIFTCLFVSAWYANEFNEKRYFSEKQNDTIQVLTIEEIDLNEKFRPREYIKIKR